MILSRIRWWLVALFVGLGAGVIAIGAVVSYSNAETPSDTAEFWAGLWVNIGTSLLLAAALVAFERAIVKNVREQNKKDIDHAVDRAADDAAKRTADAIIPRLDDLDDRLRARTETETAERLATAAGLSTALSQEDLLRAMRDASDIKSIYRPSGRNGVEGNESWIGVPAGPSLDSPVIGFRYRPQSPDGNWDYWDEQLTLEHEGIVTSRVEWTLDLDPAEALAALQTAMVRNGEARAVRSMQAGSLFENLSDALVAAQLGRTASPDAWLTGEPVIEMVTERCYITQAGIEVRGLGLVLGRRIFRTPIAAMDGSADPYAAPEGLDAEVWQSAVERARHYY